MTNLLIFHKKNPESKMVLCPYDENIGECAYESSKMFLLIDGKVREEFCPKIPFSLWRAKSFTQKEKYEFLQTSDGVNNGTISLQIADGTATMKISKSTRIQVKIRFDEESHS